MNDIYNTKHKIKKVEPKRKNNYLFSLLNRLLITLVIFIALLITLKTNPNFKTKFFKSVYDSNISFASINNWYKQKFGSPIPFLDFVKKDIPVFNEKLKYNSASKYLDGVALEIEKNYMVPIIESGIVVFKGDKEGYGNTIIVQQINGIDVWYGNLGESGVKMYDYIEKGNLLSEASDKLYLVYKKDGKVLDYNEYLK